MKNILLIFGTRPEAIKLAPVIKEIKRYPKKFILNVCVTGQHREMLDQVLSFFNIKPDYDLYLMKPNQSLFDLTADGLKGLEKVINEYAPDHIVVQGDTTTAFLGALAGFYKQIPISHLEAGLRSGNKHAPYPEEINRILVGHLADYHFAPTETAAKNLFNEGIKDNVWVVGNTVIDALLWGIDIVKQQGEDSYYREFSSIDFSRKLILVTGHRRESFGKPLEQICAALKKIAENFKQIEILSHQKNIHLLSPLAYPQLIWLMSKSYFVITDSGGIQEEAPSLGKPVLVTRDVTERIEGISAGTAKLVGTNYTTIVKEASLLITDQNAYDSMSKKINPYGDGTTSQKIIEIISKVSD
jgi:UDP-N-acetylglucosamine 2-epimerase (non-hydrolysing)